VRKSRPFTTTAKEVPLLTPQRKVGKFSTAFHNHSPPFPFGAPKLNTLTKHYLPTSSADDCSTYDLKTGLPIDVFVLYLILLLQ